MLTVSKLSKLQKRILEEGLKAHWCEPIYRAWGGRGPRSFNISQTLLEFFDADKRDIDRAYNWPRRGDQRERLAKPRAAISRAMTRLTKRGFLERIERGSWRLSAQGIEAALKVCPSLQGPTRAEMIQKIKQAFLARKGHLERAGQNMPITFHDFVVCVLPGAKKRRRQGVHVEFVGLD